MIAGGGNKLPFGNYPRLLLAWVSTEAVRTQSRELILRRRRVCYFKPRQSGSSKRLIRRGLVA